jgi:serine protease Do
VKKLFRNMSVAAAIFILSLTACTKQGNESGSTLTPQEKPVVNQKPLLGRGDFRDAVINVARANIPAVVHIEVTQRQEIQNPLNQLSPFESDPFFKHFFDSPQNPRSFKRELKGIGTGMIIKADGYILTNYHVVAGATEIQVILSDERQFTARVVGTDAKTDTAVIKVASNEKLPTVTFGDSDKVQVGEWVVAIGHPRGLDQTVTQGIISAKHRQGITDPSTYQDYLQTDAAINPGNSGGPLLNLDGQVIGVNSIIASQSGGFEGIGFAVPSNMALHIANELMKSGKVERGWLGVTLQDVTYDKMKSLGLATPKGAYVVDVVKGGPAEKAGIKPGDVILAIDGRAIEDSGALRNAVAGAVIGKEIRLGISRAGKALTIPVKIGNPQEAGRMLAATLRDKLGVEVRPVNAREQGKYGLEQGLGVVIARLDPKGPLATSGFEVDDVLVQVDDQPVEGVDGFTGIVSTLKPGQKISLVVVDHRTGRVGTIQVKVR